jgi:HAD superfamily hydrolase (TIGR01490 family)
LLHHYTNRSKKYPNSEIVMGGTDKYDFFDVDHTILRGSSGPLFVYRGVRRGLFPAFTLIYIPFFYLRYYSGKLNADSRDWQFPIITGCTREQLEDISRINFETMKAKIYPDVRRLIQELHTKGRKVVLATSSLELVVRPLAEDLGIEDVIGTELEFSDGRATGRFAVGPLLKEKKKEKVYDYIQRRGVRWEDCSFYTDSVFDLALLEAVAHPVAVNPDRRLKRLASQRDWQILTFRL